MKHVLPFKRSRSNSVSSRPRRRLASHQNWPRPPMRARRIEPPARLRFAPEAGEVEALRAWSASARCRASSCSATASHHAPSAADPGRPGGTNKDRIIAPPPADDGSFIGNAPCWCDHGRAHQATAEGRAVSRTPVRRGALVPCSHWCGWCAARGVALLALRRCRVRCQRSVRHRHRGAGSGRCAWRATAPRSSMVLWRRHAEVRGLLPQVHQSARARYYARAVQVARLAARGGRAPNCWPWCASCATRRVPRRWVWPMSGLPQGARRPPAAIPSPRSAPSPSVWRGAHRRATVPTTADRRAPGSGQPRRRPAVSSATADRYAGDAFRRVLAPAGAEEERARRPGADPRRLHRSCPEAAAAHELDQWRSEVLAGGATRSAGLLVNRLRLRNAGVQAALAS